MLPDESLLSVGIDIGTTTTHMVVSSLQCGNLARPTQISQPCITDKKVLFESPIYETPLEADGKIDAGAVAQLLQDTYARAATEANLDMSEVHTGAVIITGESARTRNAQEILRQVASFAGEFVVESAGPSLESILCARGSGAQKISKELGQRVLSLDIGGGTSNFASVHAGEITNTAAVLIGGRSVRFSQGKIVRLSPTAAAICRKQSIELPLAEPVLQHHESLQKLATSMAQILSDLSAGKTTNLNGATDDLWLTPVLQLESAPDLIVISGGVASLMQDMSDSEEKTESADWQQYKDFGPYLASALLQELKKQNIKYELAANAIRATVLGAGLHTLQLTGATIDFEADCLPLKNIPIIRIDTGHDDLADTIDKQLRMNQADWRSAPLALALTGLDRHQLQYQRVKNLAEGIARAQQAANAAGPIVVATDQDIAMVLGQLLKRLVPDKRIISVDGIVLYDGDYLDIGKPVHSNSFGDRFAETLPVVVKTLIFYKN